MDFLYILKTPKHSNGGCLQENGAEITQTKAPAVKEICLQVIVHSEEEIEYL